MQNVIISKENFDSFEKDTILTLEQAEWYTQNEGFIPLPRNVNKQNIKVIFSKISNKHFYICLQKLKITKWRVSQVVDTDGKIIGYILVIHTIPCKVRKVFYTAFPRQNIYYFSKISWVSYIEKDINTNQIKCIKGILTFNDLNQFKKSSACKKIKLN